MYRATEIALHFGVTEATVLQWSRLRGFPIGAKQRVGQRVFWNLDLVKSWHASRWSSQRQRLDNKLETFHPLAS
jgi:hypothetical protein